MWFIFSGSLYGNFLHWSVSGCCWNSCRTYLLSYLVSVVAGMGVVVGASVVVTTQEGGVHTELLSSPVSPNTWASYGTISESCLLIGSIMDQPLTVSAFPRWQAQWNFKKFIRLYYVVNSIVSWFKRDLLSLQRRNNIANQIAALFADYKHDSQWELISSINNKMNQPEWFFLIDDKHNKLTKELLLSKICILNNSGSSSHLL